MGKIDQYREMISACFAEDSVELPMKQVLRWVSDNYPDVSLAVSTFTAQVHKSCVNVASAYQSKAPKILFFTSPGRTYRRATPNEVQNGALKFAGASEEAEEVEEISSGEHHFISEDTFALEQDLQRYLVKNLHKLEEGLSLWDENQPIEFPAGSRRIDILAKASDGTPVVVELKLSKGLYSVLGQVVHYRALLKRQLGVSRVRLMIVAAEISDELQLAASEIKDLTLFKYTISMQLDKTYEG